MTHNTTIETIRPERSNGHLVVVAARGGNAHQGAWLPGGVLVPACTKKATRTNWMLRNDLDVDCPRCVNIFS